MKNFGKPSGVRIIKVTKSGFDVEIILKKDKSILVVPIVLKKGKSITSETEFLILVQSLYQTSLVYWISPAGFVPYLIACLTFGVFPIVTYPPLEKMLPFSSNHFGTLRDLLNDVLSSIGSNLDVGFKLMLLIHGAEVLIAFWLLKSFFKAKSIGSYLSWGVNVFLTGVPTLSWLLELYTFNSDK